MSLQDALGGRIETYRRQKGLSRRAVAELVGRSEEWLRQVERGHRKLDSLGAALRLADLFRVDDFAAFVGREQLGGQIGNGPLEQLEELRQVLVTDVPLVQFGLEGTPCEEQSTAWLNEKSEQIWNVWRYSDRRYRLLLKLVPDAIRWLSRACYGMSGRRELLPQLVDSYGLARKLASRVQDKHLAWLAGNQMMESAVHAGDLTVWGAAACHRTVCLREQGYLDDSVRFALLSAERMRSAEALPIKGMLLLSAAQSAATKYDHHEASRLLASARAIADELGKDVEIRRILFGPTEVGIGEMQIALRLGDIAAAARLARTMEIPSDHSLDRRVVYLISLAYTYARQRDDVAAVFTLNQIENLSTDDLRYEPTVWTTLRQLNQRNHVVVRSELARLSRIAGVV